MLNQCGATTMTISAIPGIQLPTLQSAVAVVKVDGVLDSANASLNATKGLYKGTDGSIYIDSAGLAAGATLNPSKVQLTSGGRQWSPRNSEAIGLRSLAAGGYEVMLKQGDGSTAKYSTQAFDVNGIAVGRAEKLTTVGMLSAETTFDQDFSGDNLKGDRVVTVVDATDGGGVASDVGLYKLTSGRFAVDLKNKTATAAIGAGTVFLTSNSKSWTPKNMEALAVRKTGEGFEVLLKQGDGTGAKFLIQAFDTQGASVGRAEKLTTAGMLSAETTYDQDFSGDNLKGDRVVSVADSTDGGGVASDIGLYKLTSGRFAIDLENKSATASMGAGVVYLTNNGRNWSSGSAEAVAVRKTNVGFEVLLKTIADSNATFSIQAFDSSGSTSGKATKLSSAALVFKESNFKQDFNADNVVGDYVTSIADSADSENSYGLYETKSGYYGVGIANLQVGSQSTLTYLENRGKMWAPRSATAVAVEVDNDGLIRVATRSGTGESAKVSETTFSAAGSASGNATAIKPVGLSAKELNYDQDLNGDGKVGNSAFKIEINYTGDSAYKSYFVSAAQRWSEVIMGDLADVGQVDDLKITANVSPIDGVSGVLGNAGPSAMRTNAQGGLPYLGTMTFDSADMANMVSNGTLTGVILHEMGHVLGLGTLWSAKALLDLTSGFQSGGSTYYSKYTGSYALAEYKALPGGNTSATSIPLENNTASYGAGSLGSHWRESIFNSELMTPSANGSFAISRMTVGSLKDLGYEVVFSAANSYTVGS